MDKFSKAKRSEIMAAIRGRDTLPEIVVRKWLHAHGFRFRVCDKRIVGHPDIVLPRLKTLIEIRGCFWHHHGWAWDGRKLVRRESCPQATAPKTNRAFGMRSSVPMFAAIRNMRSCGRKRAGMSSSSGSADSRPLQTVNGRSRS